MGEGTVAAARLVDGGIVDVLHGTDGRRTEARFERCAAGWQAVFTLTDPAVDDLAVVHRLVAPTLREARAAVPQAVGFLLGEPLDDNSVERAR